MSVANCIYPATAGERRVFIPRSLAPRALRGAGAVSPVRRFAGATMGTRWSASLVADGSLSAERLRSEIEGAFALVVRQMSGWDPESDLRRFNRAPAGSWHRLPAEFFAVLRRALEIAELAGGAYDPTIGDAVNAWGFGPDEAPERAPDSNALRSQGRWRRLRLDVPGRAACQPGGLALDLSSIAKGYAVDLAAERLEALGVESYLVEIGGELRGRGCKPDAQPWWCEIEQPDGLDAAGSPAAVFALCDGALATSGDYRRQRSVEGRIVSHLIDSSTGMPNASDLASASVYADNCMDADAYATALFCLGATEGLAFADREGIAALFRIRGKSGIEDRLSAPMAAMLD